MVKRRNNRGNTFGEAWGTFPPTFPPPKRRIWRGSGVAAAGAGISRRGAVWRKGGKKRGWGRRG